MNEAISHRAIHHPYLKALAAGEFRDMRQAIQDFASQYGFYSAWFPRYLTALISKLEEPKYRSQLLDNLSEESGRMSEHDLEVLRLSGIKREWVQGIPHPQLFRRFQLAIGVSPDNAPGIEVDIWRESFLSLIQYSSVFEAVGALGPGTEYVVKHIYAYIIQAIEKHTSLTLEQYVFFPLHTDLDDEHGLILIDIARRMSAGSPEGAYEIRKGMLKSLNLRAAFWDAMYEHTIRNQQ